MPRPRRIANAALLLCLAVGVAPGARAEPCDVAAPLAHRDPLLQNALEGALDRAGFGTVLRQKKLSVSLVDLTRPGTEYYAGVNDDHMVYAASLPKIGILLAVFEAVARGDVEWDETFRYRLGKMITISDNADATWGARLVGLRYIADIMVDPRYCLYEGGVGGLWVGRAFEKGGESYRDPLKSISHGATSRQTARFYVLLDREQLVTPYWSRVMLDLMTPPEYIHKFVKALWRRPRLEFVARKSGTWQDFHADSALIQHDRARYVLVGLSDHEDGEEMLRAVAPIADDVVTRGSHRSW